jgi:serine/threonine protein phosphatase PrpC
VFDEMAYDSLLICSDGFWGCVSEQEMCSTLEQSATPQQWLEKMRKLRNENVNQDNDNNTAVVIFIKEV